MSLDRIQAQLAKWELAKADDEMRIGVMAFGRFVMFGDAGGDNVLIADKDAVSRELNAIRSRNGTLNREAFWAGDWLDESPLFRGLDELWSELPAPAQGVFVSVPRCEPASIGRARRIDRDNWLLETENGEYALVPDKETRKWIVG